MTFLGMLLLMFIGMKLIGVLTWSWWWILSPAWITFLVAWVAAAIKELSK